MSVTEQVIITKRIMRRKPGTSKKNVQATAPMRYTNQNRQGIRNHSLKGIRSSSAQCMLMQCATGQKRSTYEKPRPKSGQQSSSHTWENSGVFSLLKRNWRQSTLGLIMRGLPPSPPRLRSSRRGCWPRRCAARRRRARRPSFQARPCR